MARTVKLRLSCFLLYNTFYPSALTASVELGVLTGECGHHLRVHLQTVMPSLLASVVRFGDNLITRGNVDDWKRRGLGGTNQLEFHRIIGSTSLEKTFKNIKPNLHSSTARATAHPCHYFYHFIWQLQGECTVMSFLIRFQHKSLVTGSLTLFQHSLSFLQGRSLVWDEEKGIFQGERQHHACMSCRKQAFIWQHSWFMGIDPDPNQTKYQGKEIDTKSLFKKNKSFFAHWYQPSH